MSVAESCFNQTILAATLKPNADIAGLGVRLSFYLQTFILVLLVNRSPDGAPGALWTLTATSCGLTVAAIVQLTSNKLFLIDAILVSQLVWLANIASFIASASYSRYKGGDSIVKFVTVGQAYFSMILTIVMWRYADKLGPYPECNGLVKFVMVFAVERPALGSGRTAALVCSSAILCGYTFLTMEELAVWWKYRRARASKIRNKAPKRSVNQAVGDFQRNPRKRRSSVPHNNWLSIDVDPIFVGVVLLELIIFAYFLSTTELIIIRAGIHQDVNNTWGFGQVFALMVLTPSVVALYMGVKENKVAKKRDQRRQKQESQDRAAEEGRSRRQTIEWTPDPTASTL